MTLVSSHKALPDPQHPNKTASTQSQKVSKGDNDGRKVARLEDDDDPDLQRALDLVDLHYGVKMKHVQGQDMALKKAREEVQRVLRER